MANTVDHKICSQSRLGGGSSLGLLIGLILFSFPAQFYRVSGVWAAIDSQFPIAANETCIAVKTFGVGAVSKKSIPEMIIFAKDRRFDVKGDGQTEKTIKSIKAADGGFQISDSFSKNGKWLRFKRKRTYLLTVIDPLTIEIRDGTLLTRYVKCGPQKPAI